MKQSINVYIYIIYIHTQYISFVGFVGLTAATRRADLRGIIGRPFRGAPVFSSHAPSLAACLGTKILTSKILRPFVRSSFLCCARRLIMESEAKGFYDSTGSST